MCTYMYCLYILLFIFCDYDMGQLCMPVPALLGCVICIEKSIIQYRYSYTLIVLAPVIM